MVDIAVIGHSCVIVCVFLLFVAKKTKPKTKTKPFSRKSFRGKSSHSLSFVTN